MQVNTDSIISTNKANHDSLKAEDIQTASDETVTDISERLIEKYLEAYKELAK